MAPIRATHTYALLPLPRAVYEAVREAVIAAAVGPDNRIHEDEPIYRIDMNGVAVCPVYGGSSGLGPIAALHEEIERLKRHLDEALATNKALRAGDGSLVALSAKAAAPEVEVDPRQLPLIRQA